MKAELSPISVAEQELESYAPQLWKPCGSMTTWGAEYEGEIDYTKGKNMQFNQCVECLKWECVYRELT